MDGDISVKGQSKEFAFFKAPTPEEIIEWNLEQLEISRILQDACLTIGTPVSQKSLSYKEHPLASVDPGLGYSWLSWLRDFEAGRRCKKFNL